MSRSWLPAFLRASNRQPIRNRPLALAFEPLEGREVPAALAVWNFNDSNLTVDTIGAGVVGTPTLTSDFVAANLVYFGGSTTGANPPDIAGQALALQPGTSFTNNGKNATFTLNTAGFQDLIITFATQRSGTGFNSNQFQYTTDGTTWTDLGSPYTPPSSFGLQTFDASAIDALENNANAGFRIVFNGGSNATGNNRIDNFVISGSAPAVAPTVTTPTSAAITATTADLGGNVTSDGNGAITERGVVYSLTATNNDPLINGTGVTKVTTPGTTGVFIAGVTGLTPNSGYSFKAYAINSAGTTYTSPASTFSTAAQVAPTVTNPTSTLITSNSATLGGNVTSDGFDAITERGVVYSPTATNADPIINGTGVIKVTAPGTTGVFTAPVSGLTANTGYSFKAYAINSQGTTYTIPASTFTTDSSASAPTVDTPTVTAVTGSTATLGGNVLSDGGGTITERGVVYSLTATNANPLINGTGVTKVTAAGTTGVFTAPITSLTSNSGYSFKAYAINSAGTTYTSPVNTFTTDTVPTITTPTAVAVFDVSATLGGNVTGDGGEPITQRGVVYSLTSTNANPLIGGTGVTTVMGTGTTGVFTVPVSSLTSLSGYSFKAYAINSVGTVYTAVSTFTTTAAPTHYDALSPMTAEIRLITATSIDNVGNTSGIRTFNGATSTQFFNVEGSGLGSFQVFSVADFVPVANPSVTSLGNVTLTISESPAAFSAPGNVQIYVATVTDPNQIDVTMNPTAGAPAYVSGQDGLASIDPVFAPLTTLLGTATYALGSGIVVNLDVLNPAVNTLFLNAVQNGTRLRLLATADPSTPNVAFTGAGSTGAAPVLSYDAFGSTTFVTPTIDITSDAANPAVGATVNFTATFSSTNGVPTGTYDYYANGLKLNASSLAVPVNGIANFSIGTNAIQVLTNDKLTPGINEIEVRYTATGNFLNTDEDAPQKVQANAFGANDILVLRNGDGYNLPSANGNRTYIDVFLAGMMGQTDPVQSIILPTVAEGLNKPVLTSGTVSTDTQLVLSPDGKYAYFTAYNAEPTNVFSLHASSASVIPRVVGRLTLADGKIETSMALTDVASGGVFRGLSVTSTGGIYATGGQTNASGAGGIRYIPAYNAATTTSTNLGSGTIGFTGLTIAGTTPQLFVASPNNGAGTHPKAATVGTGLETTGTPAVTSLLDASFLPAGVVPKNPQSLFFADLDMTANFNGTGLDTMYISEIGTTNLFTGGTITKWSFVGGVWTLNDTITANTAGIPGQDNDFTHLTGRQTGNTVNLVITNGDGGSAPNNEGGGQLWSLADSGFNTTFANPAPTPLANASDTSKKLFRGVVQLPSGAATPTATGFTVNNGDPQRSRIVSIEVLFSGPVLAADFNGLGAISLQRTAVSTIPTGIVGDLVQTGPAAANHITVAQGAANSLILTFDNNGSFLTTNVGVENGSLSDGYWQLTAGTFVSTLNDLNLRRLYGDSTSAANGSVDGSDLGDFGNNFSSNSIAYDFNNDGSVDGSDLGTFGNRFGNVL